MIVTVDHAVRNWADDLFADLTTKAIIDHGEDDAGHYFVQFAVNLTAAEEAAIRRRLATSSGIEETLNARAVAAYQDLQAFENLTTPTNAQVVAVVRLLCKVARALIRLQLRQLDAAD